MELSHFEVMLLLGCLDVSSKLFLQLDFFNSKLVLSIFDEPLFFVSDLIFQNFGLYFAFLFLSIQHRTPCLILFLVYRFFDTFLALDISD